MAHSPLTWRQQSGLASGNCWLDTLELANGKQMPPSIDLSLPPRCSVHNQLVNQVRQRMGPCGPILDWNRFPFYGSHCFEVSQRDCLLITLTTNSPPFVNRNFAEFIWLILLPCNVWKRERRFLYRMIILFSSTVSHADLWIQYTLTTVGIHHTHSKQQKYTEAFTLNFSMYTALIDQCVTNWRDLRRSTTARGMSSPRRRLNGMFVYYY